MNHSTYYMLLLFCLSSCLTENGENLQDEKVSSFEISYAANYDEKFSFFVDSNNIYLIPNGHNLSYGVLPDSIMNFISEKSKLLSPEAPKKSQLVSCDECPRVAIIYTINRDTIKFHQKGMLDTTTLNLIKMIQYFVNDGEHRLVDPYTFWKTRPAVTPMPPAIVPH